MEEKTAKKICNALQGIQKELHKINRRLEDVEEENENEKLLKDDDYLESQIL